MLTKSLPEALLATELLMQKTMAELLTTEHEDSRIVQAMRYSALSGGKRIRPFLLIISAEIFGVKFLHSLQAAAALEFLHTYSLIHDDLPAMDNDTYRRGKLTCHKQFDEATAILAGDGLLTYAFEILTDEKTHKNPSVRLELVKTLAHASGFQGMIGGQMLDIETADKKISKEQLANLHRLKTGELFMAACEMGAILGNAGPENRKAMRYYAHDLGLAFQIKDDILDHIELGSIAKVDIDEMKHKKVRDNASIVDLVGIENATKQLAMLRDQAIEHLKPFGEKALLLKDLAEFIISREK